jgi:hypothetical protein
MCKRLSVTIGLAVLLSFTLKACPICGCGGGNLYMGLMPDFKYHFIGLRYHYTQYHTQLISDPSQFSTNYYNSVELWGGMRVSNKLQLLAFVPYYMNRQIDDDGITRTQGLGDITIMGQYLVFKSSRHAGNRKTLNQQLWFGGGIKLPTGSFNADMLDSNTTVADINAQIGTGSVDFLLNGMYVISIRNFGVSVSANYKINTVNDENYKFGNKFTGNLIAFYNISAGQNTITPNIGLGYENVATNSLQRKDVPFTGSQIMTAIAGVEMNFGKISVGVNGQLPMAQRFAEGQTKMRFNGMMHVTYQL